MSRTTFIDESVFAFVLVLKSGKFRMLQGKQRTHHLVSANGSVCSMLLHIRLRVWSIIYCSIGNPKPQNG